MSKIGRNDPCPCGSGKKYKYCCGITGGSKSGISEPNYFEINRDIAYRGKIGKQRQDFCIRHIEAKKRNIKKMQAGQAKMAEKLNVTISCEKGCHYCCAEYVEASIQECETIVYYLYQHDDLLKNYLKKYPKWREEIRNNGDLFKECGKLWQIEVTPENVADLRKQSNDENQRYHEQNIMCPFLDNGLCSIYEIRPYMCVSLTSTSPREYCKPESKNRPKTIRAFQEELLMDCSFYYGELQSPIVTCMQIAVYEILKTGTYHYRGSGVPGLENLDREFCSDPDVILRLRQYGVI